MVSLYISNDETLLDDLLETLVDNCKNYLRLEDNIQTFYLVKLLSF